MKLLQIGMLIGAVMLLMSCKKNYEDLSAETLTGSTMTRVNVERLEITSDPIPVQSIGRLKAKKEYKLSFKIGGVIANMNQQEGRYVKKGQVMASLRQNEINAQVLKAERALEKVKRDLERIEKMYKDDVATLENVQDLKTLLAVSEADVDVAKFNKQYASIVSPISGRVIKRLAEPGELVSPGQPLYLLATTGNSGHVMMVSVSDRDVQRLALGDKAMTTFDAFPDEVFESRIVEIAEGADPRTATFEVELSVSAPDLRLRNGMIGRTKITPAGNDSFYILPMAAVVEADDGELLVFSPSQDRLKAEAFTVEPAYIGATDIMVKTTEFNTEEIITNGSSYLIDGDEIEIVNNR